MSDWISATIIEDDDLDHNGLDLQQKIKDLEKKVKELESSQITIKKPRKYTKKTKLPLDTALESELDPVLKLEF